MQPQQDTVDHRGGHEHVSVSTPSQVTLNVSATMGTRTDTQADSASLAPHGNAAASPRRDAQRGAEPPPPIDSGGHAPRPGLPSVPPTRTTGSLPPLDAAKLVAQTLHGFPRQLLLMMERPGSRGVVEWLAHGHAFAIKNLGRFAAEVMPQFTRGKLTSFQRQLNIYGFRKVTKGPDANAGALVYFHPAFKRGRPEMMVGAILRVPTKGEHSLNRLRSEDVPYDACVVSEDFELEKEADATSDASSDAANKRKRPRGWQDAATQGATMASGSPGHTGDEDEGARSRSAKRSMIRGADSVHRVHFPGVAGSEGDAKPGLIVDDPLFWLAASPDIAEGTVSLGPGHASLDGAGRNAWAARGASSPDAAQRGNFFGNHQRRPGSSIPPASPPVMGNASDLACPPPPSASSAPAAPQMLSRMQLLLAPCASLESSTRLRDPWRAELPALQPARLSADGTPRSEKGDGALRFPADAADKACGEQGWMERITEALAEEPADHKAEATETDLFRQMMDNLDADMDWTGFFD